MERVEWWVESKGQSEATKYKLDEATKYKLAWSAGHARPRNTNLKKKTKVLLQARVELERSEKREKEEMCSQSKGSHQVTPKKVKKKSKKNFMELGAFFFARCSNLARFDGFCSFDQALIWTKSHWPDGDERQQWMDLRLRDRLSQVTTLESSPGMDTIKPQVLYLFFLPYFDCPKPLECFFLCVSMFTLDSLSVYVTVCICSLTLSLVFWSLSPRSLAVFVLALAVSVLALLPTPSWITLSLAEQFHRRALPKVLWWRGEQVGVHRDS